MRMIGITQGKIFELFSPISFVPSPEFLEQQKKYYLYLECLIFLDFFYNPSSPKFQIGPELQNYILEIETSNSKAVTKNPPKNIRNDHLYATDPCQEPIKVKLPDPTYSKKVMDRTPRTPDKKPACK